MTYPRNTASPVDQESDRDPPSMFVGWQIEIGSIAECMENLRKHDAHAHVEQLRGCDSASRCKALNELIDKDLTSLEHTLMMARANVRNLDKKIAAFQSRRPRA